VLARELRLQFQELQRMIQRLEREGEWTGRR
jgi:hypothetical protein